MHLIKNKKVMKIFREKGFEIIGNTDLTEGRGRQYTIAYTSNRTTANYIAKGKGVMGTIAEIKPTTIKVIVFDSPEEYDEFMGNTKKINALNKLSEEEIILLGLEQLNREIN